MSTSEIELQQELRQLFDLDTQKYLQVYITTVQQLQPQTWQADIQQLYRAIHTIKGGAATVGLEAILSITTVLEDLLSDLRYLEEAPPLDDRQLQDGLLEAGELLAASLELTDAVAAAPIATHISRFHETVKQTYLSEMDDHAILCQEFAEQGFDLVVLDLDIAVETLSSQPNQEIPPEAIAALEQTMEQLDQIGQDLELAQYWQNLLAQGQDFLQHRQVEYWSANVPEWLRSLKASAKRGGKPPKTSPEEPKPAPSLDPLDQELRQLFDLDTQKDLQTYLRLIPNLQDLPWKDTIQQLYRSIHTIKGGAATVGAEPILQVSAALEDILSDLRYLEDAPPLTDGKLSQILLASGELLLGALPLYQVPQASVTQIQQWRSQIQADYLTEIDQQSQLFQEFADQGFDLVTLELEMAVEQLIPGQPIAPETLEIAQMAIAQLAEIGQEIECGPDWQTLLDQSQSIWAQPQSDAWINQVPAYLQTLKQCAKRGGRPVLVKPTAIPVPPSTAAKPVEPQTPPTSQANVQIAVPLERLERSSQFLVETMMATRATQGFYQAVHANLQPLVALAESSVQYISQLREVQDDFATLDSANAKTENGVQVEGYRQGYLAINRLLEINLRLIELGAEIGESSRRTTDSLQKLDLSLRGLQQTIEESRLVPFESLSLRARGILRDLTIRVGKPAQLTVMGEKTELDAGTLRNLEPVMLHLIRNSYDHGIELPGDRLKQGKPEAGRIEISIARRGSVFILEIKDDGAGINPAKIREIAIKKGLPLTDTDSADKLLAVLCQSGFTSAQVVSDISGRGVGMDVVASQIAAMGGQLHLFTQVGVGSRFRIQLPVPHLFVRCMLLQSGDRLFAIPAAEVFTTMLLDDLLWQIDPPDPAQLKPYSMLITEDTGDVPAVNLAQYWQGGSKMGALTSNSVAVRTKQLDSTRGIWLVADQLYGQNDLLVNPLPSPLAAPIGLFGVSLLANGTLVPVIDANSLTEAILGQTEFNFSQAAIAETESNTSLDILVVDDAALMRRRVESVLTAKGYVVHTCSDGQEAWEWLQTHSQPALVLTDIEMPRMDGFTLIDQCRQAGMDMPILVISSRLAEEWSKETRRLGATDYLTKGFSTPELLDKVAKYMETANLYAPTI